MQAISTRLPKQSFLQVLLPVGKMAYMKNENLSGA
jgi:hypothetical protein